MLGVFGVGSGAEVWEIHRPITPETASSSLVTPATLVTLNRKTGGRGYIGSGGIDSIFFC